jgi:hypothetical protein
MDLVKAFANIGLPGWPPVDDGEPDRTQSAPAPANDDYSLSAERLRNYYIMSRDLPTKP